MHDIRAGWLSSWASLSQGPRANMIFFWLPASKHALLATTRYDFHSGLHVYHRMIQLRSFRVCVCEFI